MTTLAAWHDRNTFRQKLRLDRQDKIGLSQAVSGLCALQAYSIKQLADVHRSVVLALLLGKQQQQLQRRCAKDQRNQGVGRHFCFS